MEYEFYFDAEKNKTLKASRNISFEEVVLLILGGKVIETVGHPNQEKYGHQKMFVVDVDGYAYVIPYTSQDNKVFLKTIFPSRKATKMYLKKEK